MDFLKPIFGDKALTYAELEAALKDNKEIKLANLASGQYVDKEKFDKAETRANDLDTQLKNANTTIKGFKDVDVEGLKAKVADWEKKYNDDTKALNQKLSDQTKSSKIENALLGAKAKDVKAARALLDESKISLDGDNVLGLADQIAALQKDKAWLFGEAQQQNPAPPAGGTAPGAGTADPFVAAAMKGAGLKFENDGGTK